MSGWKELTFAADEVQRATAALIEECNRQKCAEMTAHEATKKELGHALLQCDIHQKDAEYWMAEAIRLRQENDLMRQLLQVAVLSLPADEENEVLRKRICALGGQRGAANG